ncbi:uncharacterized protein LOC127251111 [Andrographis paniculata]|uniref:uncharacterized protein LOC127251111 n=1 Tax=Andrographis paniculata TaxID=175694 RepID=UPI0021E9427A|nr:uncharacterized protein LOC127251111 [Andrographis paniculata]
MGRKRRELKDNDSDNTNKAKRKKATAQAEEAGDMAEQQRRVPLSAVVLDCSERWFQDTLKEAKAGDVNMQVLVGQMYYSGYGVPKDADKGKLWISRASRMRSSSWKVSHKRPGYNASDSDTDEIVSDS